MTDDKDAEIARLKAEKRALILAADAELTAAFAEIALLKAERDAWGKTAEEIAKLKREAWYDDR